MIKRGRKKLFLFTILILIVSITILSISNISAAVAEPTDTLIPIESLSPAPSETPTFTPPSPRPPTPTPTPTPTLTPIWPSPRPPTPTPTPTPTFFPPTPTFPTPTPSVKPTVTPSIPNNRKLGETCGSNIVEVGKYQDPQTGKWKVKYDRKDLGNCGPCLRCETTGFTGIIGTDPDFNYPAFSYKQKKCFYSPNGFQCKGYLGTGVCLQGKCVDKCTGPQDCPPERGNRECGKAFVKYGSKQLWLDVVYYRTRRYSCINGKCLNQVLENAQQPGKIIFNIDNGIIQAERGKILRFCGPSQTCRYKDTFYNTLDLVSNGKFIADCMNDQTKIFPEKFPKKPPQQKPILTPDDIDSIINDLNSHINEWQQGN